MIVSAVAVNGETNHEFAQTNPKSTIQSIVILRGIAAIGVAVVHTQKYYDFHVNGLIDFIMEGGQQGVVVFFVISGFILPYALHKSNYTINDFFSFLLKRSVRIDPAYWMSIVVYCIAAPVLLSFLTFKSIVGHIFYLIPFMHGVFWYSGVFWTLAIEFQFYIVLGLSFPYLIRMNNYLACLLLIALSIAGLYLPFHLFITDKLYLFAFGYITFLAYSKKMNMLGACAILTGFCIFINMHVSYTTGLMPFITSIIILFYRGGGKLIPLIFVGNISYSLYLMHQPGMLIFQQFLTFGVKNKLFLFGGSLLFDIALAYVFFKLIEQPSIKLSKRIMWRNKKQVMQLPVQ